MYVLVDEELLSRTPDGTYWRSGGTDGIHWRSGGTAS